MKENGIQTFVHKKKMFNYDTFSTPLYDFLFFLFDLKKMTYYYIN